MQVVKGFGNFSSVMHVMVAVHTTYFQYHNLFRKEYVLFKQTQFGSFSLHRLSEVYSNALDTLSRQANQLCHANIASTEILRYSTKSELDEHFRFE